MRPRGRVSGPQPAEPAAARAARAGARILSLALLLGAIVATAGPAQAGPKLGDGATVTTYNSAGTGILATLKEIAAAFEKRSEAALAAVFHPEFDGPSPGNVERRTVFTTPDGIEVATWVIPPGPSDPPPGSAASAWAAHFASWSKRFASFDYAVFKMHLVDEVWRDGSARARFRFELIGPPAAPGKTITERGMFEARFRPAGEKGAMKIASLRYLEGETVVGPGDLFAERAKESGIDFYGKEDPRFRPPSKELKFQTLRHAIGGASAGDLDGDGHDDVVLTSGEELKVVLNKGDGTFRDATAESGLAEVRHANVTGIGDLDNDGDRDLLVGRFFGGNMLFRNEGGGRFTDVTEASGLAADEMTAVLAFADFDNDGNLDIYLGRYLDARNDVPFMIHYSRNGAGARLYLGAGGLKFRDVSEASGADDRVLFLGNAAADYDRDGDQDIYLANDFGRNVLLRNRGDATFTDVAQETGTVAISAGMGASFGDYDGDGLLDIYVSAIRSNQRWFTQDVNLRPYVLRIIESERRERLQELFLDLKRHLGDGWDQLGEIALSGNYLLRQKPDGTFEDVSEAARARPPGWYWSNGFFDLENDGRLDILAVNGWITGKKKHDL